jgi:hypothetical protein
MKYTEGVNEIQASEDDDDDDDDDGDGNDNDAFGDFQSTTETKEKKSTIVMLPTRKIWRRCE